MAPRITIKMEYLFIYKPQFLFWWLRDKKVKYYRLQMYSATVRFVKATICLLINPTQLFLDICDRYNNKYN